MSAPFLALLLAGNASLMLILFFFCYYGKIATDSYAAYGDCVYNMDWIDYPNDLKRYMILIISDAQIPRRYHGFGMAYCNLQTFSKV